MHKIRSKRTAARLVALLGAAVFAAACSSDTAPSASQQLDVSAALSSMSVPGVSSAVSTMSPTASSADVDAPAIVPTSCTYSATTQSFTCPTVTVNGLTITRSYTLLDAQQQPQSAPDKATTDGIRTETTVKGTMTMRSGSMTVDGQKVMTLTGLLANKPLLNGTGSSTMTGTMTMGTTSTPFSLTTADTTTNLALPPKGSTTHYPLGGSVEMSMTSSGALAGSSSSMKLAFDGSNFATLTLSNSFGTEVCKLDLTGKTAMSCTAQ